MTNDDYFVRERLYPKKKTSFEIREEFKTNIKEGHFYRFFGVTSAIEAMILQDYARKTHVDIGLYISGAGTSTYLGVPDIGIMSLEEVVMMTKIVARATDLPVLVDIDTGYDDVAKAVKVLEEAGASAVHLEDQVFPKRCGHLDGKEVIDTASMKKKIASAVKARNDKNFMVMARSDAKAVEGMNGLISRLVDYVDAGADLIFPEAMNTLKEFEQVRDVLSVPLLANLTENGKTPLGIELELKEMGYGIALYPVTFLRSHMQFVENAVVDIVDGGTKSYNDFVMPRNQCMYYLQYDEYVASDEKLAGHGQKINEHKTKGEK